MTLNHPDAVVGAHPDMAESVPKANVLINAARDPLTAICLAGAAPVQSYDAAKEKVIGICTDLKTPQDRKSFFGAINHYSILDVAIDFYKEHGYFEESPELIEVLTGKADIDPDKVVTALVDLKLIPQAVTALQNVSSAVKAGVDEGDIHIIDPDLYITSRALGAIASLRRGLLASPADSVNLVPPAIETSVRILRSVGSVKPGSLTEGSKISRGLKEVLDDPTELFDLATEVTPAIGQIAATVPGDVVQIIEEYIRSNPGNSRLTYDWLSAVGSWNLAHREDYSNISFRAFMLEQTFGTAIKLYNMSGTPPPDGATRFLESIIANLDQVIGHDNNGLSSKDLQKLLNHVVDTADRGTLLPELYPLLSTVNERGFDLGRYNEKFRQVLERSREAYSAR